MRAPGTGSSISSSENCKDGLYRVPKLPHYTRYHRILRNAERLVAELALSVLPDNQVHLIDSKPLPVAKGKRSSWSKFPEARKGFSTMGMVFGFKLHALTNLNGLFERWAFAAANHPDVRLARELTAGLEGQLVLGDKAYIGSSVLTPKRSNMRGSNAVWSESLDRTRKRIEASFSTLGEVTDPSGSASKDVSVAQDTGKP